jgi:hypothetical protein
MACFLGCFGVPASKQEPSAGAREAAEPRPAVLGCAHPEDRQTRLDPRPELLDLMWGTMPGGGAACRVAGRRADRPSRRAHSHRANSLKFGYDHQSKRAQACWRLRRPLCG